MKMKSIFLFSLTLFTLAACKREPDPEPGIYASGVFVLNEGAFQAGNASVSFFDRATKVVKDDIYRLANGTAQGDVFQSMSVVGEKAYLVMNNSGKILVANANDFSAISSINGFSSPRYILNLSSIVSAKAYVSDWVSNQIKIVNLITDAIVDSISVGSGPEEMVLASGKVFVANSGGFSNDSTIFVIDPSNNVVLDTIYVGLGPSALRVDANGKLWVLCLGNYGFSGPEVGGSLVRINPANNSIETQFNFSTSEHPSRMDMNSSKTELYFVNNGIYKMGITDAGLPASAFSSHSFYGIGVDPSSDLVYGADPVDYSQRGKVFRYNPDGSVVDSFGVGYVPNGFFFR